MSLIIRRSQVLVTRAFQEAGRQADIPLVKVAVVVVVGNPAAGAYKCDLGALTEASVELGKVMGSMLVEVLPGSSIQSYGKGGIVGIAGEQEHANALLTTAFANPIRDAIGGAEAWISSMTKVGGPGSSIDVPMNNRYDIYVRSHYDGMSLVLPDAPLPDEIALIFCAASGGRLNARVGGMTHDEALRARNGGK